jgi:hypothetical protein
MPYLACLKLFLQSAYLDGGLGGGGGRRSFDGGGFRPALVVGL